MVPLDVFGTVKAPKLPPGPLWFVAFGRYGYRRAVLARSERAALERVAALTAEGWEIREMLRGFVVRLDEAARVRAWRGHREAAVRRWLRDELAEYARRFGALPETFTRTRPPDGGDSFWLDATETRPRVKVWYRGPGRLAETFEDLVVRTDHDFASGFPVDPPAGPCLPRVKDLRAARAVDDAQVCDVNPEAAPPFCYATLATVTPEDPLWEKIEAAEARGRGVWETRRAAERGAAEAVTRDYRAEREEEERAHLRRTYGEPGEPLAP